MPGDQARFYLSLSSGPCRLPLEWILGLVLGFLCWLYPYLCQNVPVLHVDLELGGHEFSLGQQKFLP
ncbi:Hypothetical predicted protein [Podarcis lilfordi]|uniref:Uncharacterized protein n=1 Tax=Podarcis lilfordi TaxID=74358 RepID=A0AA35PMM9_9SAUR|nr:Hypothetical predicted protein [Podarcis lilfordi]